ncbi:SDR family oxidoreductase [Mumia zhuanghuii]|uniref:SDR family oxidoreductase n=1 Tax=Mumia zhuanghuii TaxID=2585211 RepID=A0A5Q6RR60_9ACTN|nr:MULTISPECIES: SDR family oxidoreductase [Mumia]KAA1420490.1 SDR family oxidoreductase [Mumia zhuanghuii]
MSDGRVVVVTGGTRGIGLGLARELLARGCRVVVCGRSSATVESAVAELAALAPAGPDSVAGQVADVTDRASLAALRDLAVARFGQVDVWINNAGMSAPRRPLPEVPADVAEAVVRTNVLGVMHGCAVAMEAMGSQADGGWIWNMEGFGSGGQMQPGMTTYGATKRGVTYLTESLVKELKGSPVKVGFLSPGIVATDLLLDDYDGQPEEFERARKIFNILGDRVETVTPWLADGILGARKHGAKVAWLTTPKAMGRFLTAGFRKRDIFTPEPEKAAV